MQAHRECARSSDAPMSFFPWNQTPPPTHTTVGSLVYVAVSKTDRHFYADGHENAARFPWVQGYVGAAVWKGKNNVTEITQFFRTATRREGSGAKKHRSNDRNHPFVVEEV